MMTEAQIQLPQPQTKEHQDRRPPPEPEKEKLCPLPVSEGAEPRSLQNCETVVFGYVRKLIQPGTPVNSAHAFFMSMSYSDLLFIGIQVRNKNSLSLNLKRDT